MIPLDVTTLIINGHEVRVTPTSFDAQPARSRTVVNLPCGPVLVIWPGQEATLTLSAGYENLDEEDAEAIVALCTQSSLPSNTLAFSPGGPLYTCKSVRCELTEAERGWTASISGILNWSPL